MARWTDIATWAGPVVNRTTGGQHRVDGLVIHIAEGTFDGTIAWQRNPAADVSSHFVVAKDGRIVQLVDTADAAWTQKSGNGKWLSVENEGRTPGALTAQQIEANARIFAKVCQVYGVPCRVTGSPALQGLGHHSMGAESGVDWGHSDCPGPAIKAQKPQIVARALALLGGAAPTSSGTSEEGFLMSLSNQDQDNIAFTLLRAPNGPAHVRDGIILQRLDAALAQLAELTGRPAPQASLVITDEQVAQLAKLLVDDDNDVQVDEQTLTRALTSALSTLAARAAGG